MAFSQENDVILIKLEGTGDPTVYVPTASGVVRGIASFKYEDFIVDGGHVEIKPERIDEIIKPELEKKVDRIDTSGLHAYTHNGEDDGEIPISSIGGSGTLVQTQPSGQVVVPLVPSSNNSATSKQYVDTKIDKTEKGAPDGVAPLGEDGIIPIKFLSIPGDLKYRGTWNPAAIPNPINWNNPEDEGSYYKAEASGEFPVGSGILWNVGDWIISKGTIWERIPTDTPTAVLPEGDKVLMRTPDGRAKGANAIEPDDLVNKSQLDGFRNRVQTAADNVDYAITVAIQSAGVADTALNNSVDAQTQSGQAIDTADAADESAKLTAARTKAINDKMQNAADNADFSVSMVMTLLAELEDIKQRLTALENN